MQSFHEQSGDASAGAGDLSRWLLGLVFGPGGGKELVETIGSPALSEALDNVPEVGMEVDVGELRGADDGVQDRGGVGSGVRPCKHPILSANGDRPQRALGTV